MRSTKKFSFMILSHPCSPRSIPNTPRVCSLRSAMRMGLMTASMNAMAFTCPGWRAA